MSHGQQFIDVHGADQNSGGSNKYGGGDAAVAQLGTSGTPLIGGHFPLPPDLRDQVLQVVIFGWLNSDQDPPDTNISFHYLLNADGDNHDTAYTEIQESIVPKTTGRTLAEMVLASAVITTAEADRGITWVLQRNTGHADNPAANLEIAALELRRQVTG